MAYSRKQWQEISALTVSTIEALYEQDYASADRYIELLSNYKQHNPNWIGLAYFILRTVARYVPVPASVTQGLRIGSIAGLSYGIIDQTAQELAKHGIMRRSRRQPFESNEGGIGKP